MASFTDLFDALTITDKHDATDEAAAAANNNDARAETNDETKADDAAIIKRMMEFTQTVKGMRSSSAEHSLADTITNASKSDGEKWCKCAVSQLRYLLSLQPSPLKDDDHADAALVKASLSYVTSVINVCGEWLSDEKRSLPSSLWDIASILHNTIFELPSDDTVINGIVKLCETFWLQKRPKRDALIPASIMVLFLRALDVDGKKADVIRLHKMKEGLLQLDLQDESSAGLVNVMVRCMIHPLFLRLVEGRRLLSFLFGLTSSLTKDLHTAIKNQLPACRASLLTAYGEVYWRAWQLSDGQIRILIENNCIQDLMYLGIHVKIEGTAKAIRRVLSSFHSKKRERGVDEMLNRLYLGILWRSMNAANPIVRRNAAALFIDAFPVQNPAANRQDTDDLLQKQFDQLQLLLSDGDISLRTLGVHGVCRILGVYWELIPHATIKQLLKRLVEDLAFDSSAPAIRAAVFEGLSFVLDNPLSHSILKSLLPKLHHLLFDRSERVQLSMLSMLLVVQKIRAIKITDIVPLDNLMRRLHSGTPRVRARIVELLLPTYFPYTSNAATQLVRALALVRKNPDAAKAFFAVVHQHVPNSAVCKLVLVLYRCLVRIGKKKTGADTDSDSDGSDDGAEVDASDNSDHNDDKDGSASDNDSNDDDDTKRGTKRKAVASSKSKSKTKASTKGAKKKHKGGSDSNDDADDDDGTEHKSSKKGKAGTKKKAVAKSDKSAKRTKTAAASSVAVLDLEGNVAENVLLIMAQLWHSIDQSSDEFKQLLIGTFTDGTLQLLLKAYPSDVCRIAIITMAAHLPIESTPELAFQCLPQLAQQSLSSSVAEYGPLLECMFSWGKQRDVLSLVAIGLETGLGEKKAVASKKKDKDASSNLVLHPTMAVRYLSYLLENDRTRQMMLSPPGSVPTVGPFPRIMSLLNTAEARLQAKLRGDIDSTSMIDDDFLLSAYSLYLRALLHRQAHQHREQIKASIERRKASKIAAKAAASAPAVIAAKKKAPSKKGRKKKQSKDDDNDDSEVPATDDEKKIAALLDDSGFPLAVEEKHVDMIDPDSSPSPPASVQAALNFVTTELLPLLRVARAATSDDAATASASGEGEKKRATSRKGSANGAKAKVKSKTKSKAKPKSKKASTKKGKRKASGDTSDNDDEKDASDKDSNDEESDDDEKAEKKASPGGGTPTRVGELAEDTLIMVCKIACELVTLGFQPDGTTAALTWPVPNLLETCDTLRDLMAAQFSSAAYDVPLLAELLPVFAKLAYQLAIVPNTDPNDGGNDDGYIPVAKQPSSQLLLAILRLIACTKATQQAMLVAHPLIRSTLTHVLKAYCARKRNARQFITLLLESMLPPPVEGKSDQRASLVDTVEELPALHIMLLTVIARSPAAVHALPKAVEGTLMSHEGERYISEVARLLSALALLGDIHIKLPTKRRGFLDTLGSCAMTLQTSLPSAQRSTDDEGKRRSSVASPSSAAASSSSASPSTRRSSTAAAASVAVSNGDNDDDEEPTGVRATLVELRELIDARTKETLEAVAPPPPPAAAARKAKK